MEDEDAQRRRGRSRLFGDDDEEEDDDDDDVGVVDGQECNAEDDVDARDVLADVDDARAREITDASRGDACSMSSTTSASDAFVRHASTDSLSSAPKSERVRFSASLRQLYRLRSGEYVAVGAAGLAILDAAGATSRDVLVYDPEKRPLVRRSIDSRLSLESQKDNYVTLRHGHGETILWSALMQDEGDWTALAAQMVIAQYISRCKCEGFRDDIMIIDLAKSSSTALTLSVGDSAQVSYEAVRGGILGGVAVDEACIDYLDLQLFDGAIERVNGRKVKISTTSADSVPSAVLRGVLGAGKDSRRLILAPSAPSSFVLYDVTVARTKKGAKEGGVQSILTPLPLALDAREEDDLRDRIARLDALDGRSPAAHAIQRDSNPQNALPETPPAPWWPPASMPYADQVFLTDLRRAVSSLSEDVAFITQRARTGGVWIPPTLEGELKHAVLELNKVRLSAMLPKLEAETLSMGDVKQLTAEAARIEQFQEEIRELREGMKRMRTELHDALECTSRAEEERDALESQVSLLRRQSEQYRERIEIQKRRAEMSGAASAAAAVEAVLVAEDKSFDTDVAEVTAMMRAENEKLMNRLENPGWIEEQDALLAERDALARRVAELEKGSSAS